MRTSVSFKMANTAITLLLLCCAACATTAQAGPAALVSTVDRTTVASNANSTVKTSFDFFYFVRHACLSCQICRLLQSPRASGR